MYTSSVNPHNGPTESNSGKLRCMHKLALDGLPNYVWQNNNNSDDTCTLNILGATFRNRVW